LRPGRIAEIASLTGLRGLAALLVIVSHYWVWTRVTPTAELPVWMEPWTSTAALGMAIFFTLSGYVIALSYAGWDWRERPLFSLIRLFFYRFARLYPAFFLFAVLVVLRSTALRDLSDRETQRYLVPHLLFWQTWSVKYDGELASDDQLHVSWSLSVECALYLAFGLGAILVAALPRWRYKPLFLAIVFFVSTTVLVRMAWFYRHDLAPDGWTNWDWGRWLFHVSPYAVSLQFAIGVAAYRLSLLSHSPRLAAIASHLGAACLVAVYLLVARNVLRDLFDVAILTSLSTALLMIGGLSDTVVNRLLAGRTIVYVGTISYSLYLFHFVTPYHAAHFLTALTLAVMLATGIYRLVEVPGRRVIRAAADRLLGIASPARVARQQPEPAE
jgi:peptidoglycan/LPS O-acetylase OafA/YrhL